MSIRIVKQEPERRYTLGVVYEPDEVDAHGDMATAETIEKAAWEFAKNLQHPPVVAKAAQIVSAIHSGEECRIDITDLADDLQKARGALRDMHQDDGLPPPGEIVESYLTPAPFVLDGVGIKKGAWLLGVQWTEDGFAKVKSGERSGLSLGGRAFRVPVVHKAGE